MPPIFDLAITCPKGQRYVLRVVAKEPLNGFNDSRLLLNQGGASLGLIAVLKTFEATRVERRFIDLPTGRGAAVGTWASEMTRISMEPAAQGASA